MTAPTADGGADREIDVAHFVSELRQQVSANPRALTFRIARRPGIAWIDALRRERRRRRSKAADGQVRIDVSLRALLRLDDAEFVRKAYIKLLGRRADPSGLSSHIALLNGKWSSKIKVLEILRASPEGRARNARVAGLTLAVLWIRAFVPDTYLRDLIRYDGRDFVDRVYSELLRREPDPRGYAHRLQEAKRGWSGKISILAELVASPEGRGRNLRVRGLLLARAWRKWGRRDACLQDLLRYDGSEFVDQVYARLLHRDPDPRGYAHRLAEAKHGWSAKIGILAELVASPEGRSRNLRVRGLLLARAWRKWGHYDARLQDLLRYDGSEFVDQVYARVLHRDPDSRGYAHRLAEAERGWPGKIGILTELVASPEGQSRKIRIRGLLLARAWRKWARYDVRLGEMLRYDGSEFVDQVYARLLRREPPPLEHAPHAAEARRGRAGKINVLAGVVASPEGRRKGLRVRGLAFAILSQRLYQRTLAAGRRLIAPVRPAEPAETDAVKVEPDRIVVEAERSEA